MAVLERDQVEAVSRERSPRSARLLAGELIRADRRAYSLRIRNLSATGLGGVSEAPLHKGERVEALLPGIGPVSGQVAWASGERFGMAFDHDIDLTAAMLPPPPPPEESIVPPQFRPTTDCRRPGFKVR